MATARYTVVSANRHAGATFTRDAQPKSNEKALADVPDRMKDEG